jgi:hypothetical protein
MPTKTELIWDGKYDAKGQRVAPLRVALPFQAVETINETARPPAKNSSFHMIRPTMIAIAILLGLCATPFVASATEKAQKPWTPELKQDLLGHVQQELDKNERDAAFNHGWAITFLVGAVVINLAVAVASASANSHAPFIVKWKSWFLYGAAIGSVFAATVTSLPELTGVAKLRALQLQRVADLNVLNLDIETESISVESANSEYARIVRKNLTSP